MQEPPTPITTPSPARGPRFVRAQPSPPAQPPPPAKPKLKKLRVGLVVLGLSILAVISTIFGMLMAVASDLPSLENTAEFKAAENSVMYADEPGCDLESSCAIAKLTGNQNRILVGEGDISPYIKNAVIAIEDRRFYHHHGVDYKGIARAAVQDVLRTHASQGGSTITQQFVKNALSAQGDRSVFQKLREAALAYHLEREWSKEKILTQYLNTVYFGNGAYGVESAVRTYFGGGDATSVRQARDVSPAEAALLAGMISSPSMYDPIENPPAAQKRRDLVLQRMLEQRMITRPQYEEALRTPLPDEHEINPPRPVSTQPYFTSWLTQQLVDRYGAGLVFGGGLKIRTTIDPELQTAAEQAIAGRLGGIGPSASMVAIDNKTGAVKAMVGGSDFDTKPFNLATNGHRQPGSSIKPFILVRALEDGVSPDSVWASQPKTFVSRNGRGQRVVFTAKNYEDSYLGSASLWSATATSDNSVFAELGMKEKPRRIARLAERMGIRTRLSTNPAMVLGGLKEGVTPLEMAYAYSTIANDGMRVSGSLAPDGNGPVGIESVEGSGVHARNKTEGHRTRVFPEKVGELAKEMLHLVVTSGTGKAAQVGDEYIWGKTGTTENYGDAWFVGGNSDLTVAVWVGYPDKLVPMETEHAGGPVAGGTFPAEIFHDFMTQWLSLRESRHVDDNKDQTDTSGGGYTPAPPVDQSGVPPAEQGTTTPSQPKNQQKSAPKASPQPQTPAQPPSQQTPTPAEPTPAPTTPPSGGGGGNSGGGVAPQGTAG
jgi:penicillin-binding protein 1A